jgi:uncharacterized membrane protein YidH (DUF202 family)
MSRPLHFFGGLGMLSILSGGSIAVILLGMKLQNPQLDVMRSHGPLFVIGSVLIIAGVQLLALGLLGELQVRHFFGGQQPAPYALDRLVRLSSFEERSMVSERRREDF